MAIEKIDEEKIDLVDRYMTQLDREVIKKLNEVIDVVNKLGSVEKPDCPQCGETMEPNGNDWERPACGSIRMMKKGT